MTPQQNPFRVRRIQPGALPYLFEGMRNEHRLREMSDRIADCKRSLIVGPHGTGKSTLLASLKPKLVNRFGIVESVLLRSDCSARRNDAEVLNKAAVLSELASKKGKEGGRAESGTCLLVVDGFEQLSFGLRMRLLLHARYRRNVSILATSHRNFAGWRAVHQARAEPKTIRELTTRLIADVPTECRLKVKELLEREDFESVSDVREFWFRMYDRAADIPDTPMPETA